MDVDNPEMQLELAAGPQKEALSPPPPVPREMEISI